MKLKSKIIISFCIIIFVPIVLMMAALFSFQRIQVKAIEQTYGIKENNYSYFSNSMQLLSRFTKECFKELKDAAKNDPARLEDQEYLNELNQTLEEKSSYLIVRKDKELIYIGEDASISLLTQLPSYGDTVKDEDAGTYIDGDEQVLIKQIDFQFQDGSDGSAFIVTILEETVPEVKKLLIDVLISILLILVLTATMLTIWMYTSMINPIKKLQTAAQNIKDGNLNFSVAAETDDEIGEVCVAFEEMRLKLKGQIERNIQYEKESKELISNISHDLKTPMTAIKGYIEGIMDGVADTEEKRDRYIRTIYNKVNDMNSLIEELFLYAKLDSNSVTYSFAKVNVDAYFQDCVEEISLDLESQGVDFGYFNYADRDTVIIADPEQLKRVVNNIIGNSVKYASPDRKLMISLRIMEEAEFVKIEIEDNGKGIARNEVPLIFDRCYRTDASRNSSKGGSGLGLSIAKKIIEEHGGKIWAVSTEGVGTTMCFVLRKYKENNVYE